MTFRLDNRINQDMSGQPLFLQSCPGIFRFIILYLRPQAVYSLFAEANVQLKG